MKKNTSTYPVTIFPQMVDEVLESFIPCNVHPMKPHKYTPVPISHVLEITFGATLVLASVYKFTPLPSVRWVTITITSMVLTTFVLSIYEFITNSVKHADNDHKAQSYEFQMKQYLNDLARQEAVQEANSNPVKLAEYRSQKIMGIIKDANYQLKPAGGPIDTEYDCLYKMLCEVFTNRILTNYTTITNGVRSRYIPKMIIAFAESNLYIDLEIDIPYDLETRNAVNFTSQDHYTENAHDIFYNSQKWVVVRFAEEQVIKQTRQCCKEIAKIVAKLMNEHCYAEQLSDVEDIEPMNIWTKENCISLEAQQYRESYLEIQQPEISNPETEEAAYLEEKMIEEFAATIFEEDIPTDHEDETADEPSTETIDQTEPAKAEEAKPEVEEKEEVKEEEVEAENLEIEEEKPKAEPKAQEPIIIQIKPEPQIEIISNNKNMDNFNTNSNGQDSETRTINPDPEKPNTINFNQQKETKILPLYMNIADNSDDETICVKTYETTEYLKEIEVNEIIEQPKKDEEPQSSNGPTSIEEVFSRMMAPQTESEPDLPEAKEEAREEEKIITPAKEETMAAPQTEFESEESEARKRLFELVPVMNEYYETENWNFLLEICNTIIGLDPKFQIAYMRRSTAYGNLGKLEEAIADCKKVSELNPQNPDAYYNCGIANFMLKRYRNAIDDFKKAVANNIDNVGDVYFTIAELYNKLSDETNYLEYIHKAANHDNASAKTVLNKMKQNENNNSQSEYTGIVNKQLKIGREGVSDITFSVNDEYVAIADLGRKLRVFRTSDWNPMFKSDVAINAIAFSRNNKLMAIGGHSFLRVLNATNGEFTLASDIINYTGGVKKLFFHPFNNDILFVSDNFSIYKVDIKTKVINKAISDFQVMAISRDMQYIAGKDYFNTIKVYRINVLAEIFKLNVDKTLQIKCLALNGDCSRLIFGDSDGKIHIYNPQLPASIAIIDHKSEIIDVKISNGNYYTALTGDRKISFFNTSTAQKGREIQLRFLPKMIQISNVNNFMAIGNYNEDIDILYINDNISETADEAVRTA